jgi:hypothetical protein
MSYVEVPVNSAVQIQPPMRKIFLGAGGAFSYAVAGKQTHGRQQNQLVFGEKNWKREDISLTFTAGFEFNNGLFASINSQKGLLNTSKVSGVSAKNESLSVSVGYLIDWKKLKRKA